MNFLNATSRDLYLANQKLEEAATTDGLTRLFNRKKISELINSELTKQKKHRKMSLIMFDIDNFKRINDTYGHDMGDEVLSRIAQTAKNCIRSQDSIGRWGGEDDELKMLYKRADERLYYAKMHGKNQVIADDITEKV